jgi:hypothetical protein
MPIPDLANSSTWKRLSFVVELYRWIILFGNSELILGQANHLIALSVNKYLVETNVTERMLVWKMAEWIIQLTRDFLSTTILEKTITIPKHLIGEFACWEAGFLGWKSLALLESHLEHIQGNLKWFNQQLEIIGDRDPIARRELIHERETYIEKWTADTFSSTTAAPSEDNLYVLSETLRQGYIGAVEADLPAKMRRERVDLRDKFIGKLTEETFRVLELVGEEMVQMRKLIQKAGILKLHRKLIKSSELVSTELIRRLGRNGETERFKDQIKVVLKAVESASRALLPFTDTPLTLSLSVEDD